MRLWICEKPAQAKDIATELGITARGDGMLQTRAGVVTWAIGHLYETVAPDSYSEAWGMPWRMDVLPMIPEKWRLERVAKTARQTGVVTDLLKRASTVVVATDADREGEMIAREILVTARYSGPVERLWLRALDPASIRKALTALRPGEETEPLYYAALARSRADWLVGMNMTRAVSLACSASSQRGVRSIGRVQTPTLALVVRRDREIENFVARDFFEIGATVAVPSEQAVIAMRYAPAASPEDKRIYDRATAEALAARATGAQGPIRVTRSRTRQAPPPLFSGSGLAKACSARFGWTADQTLSIAQSLYEVHKITSYPRTDCEHVPAEQVAEVPVILGNLAAVSEFAASVAGLGGKPLIRRAVWDSSKVTAHHAIIPTTLAPTMSALSADERKAYRLIVEHYLACLYPDAEYDEVRMALDANGVPLVATGKTLQVEGWRAVMGHGETHADADAEDAIQTRLPAIPDGAAGTVQEARVEGKRTQPPKHYTEGTLLDDMKKVAKFATDPKVKARLKETTGIGTEATRASIIKLLRTRRFVQAKGKYLISTEIGREVVDVAPGALSDPSVTGLWEDELHAIAAASVAGARAGCDRFVEAVGNQVASLINRLRETVPAASSGRGPRAPTEKMLALANRYAAELGLRALPPEVESDGEACKAFLDLHAPEMKARQATGRPSEASVRFAKQVAGRKGVLVPPEVLQSQAACSAFIQTHNGKG